ncbi:diacylglycerol/lipid kinase family protein [Thalassolituus oleivorans]|uniref:diacylglycerol/lipid kinase family protein n=1 Tax=Thalassolituus oleivorans TaxID=187493 RepID=UPI001CB9D340
MTYVLIVHNPVSGSGSMPLIDRVIAGLRLEGMAVDYYATQAAGDATRYLLAYDGELDIVLAAGGDGTVNEVVNGLVDRDASSYRLALIPTGTTNVLAKELGISRNAAKIVRMIRDGATRLVYPGRINGRRFLLMAGVGYDAWVVDNVNLDLKKRVGKFAYILSMLKHLKLFGSKRYHLNIDGKEYQANSVVVTNGRYYGGSFVISRQADLSHPKTQILMMSSQNPARFLLTLLALPFGLLERMPGIVSVSGEHIVITDADHNEHNPEPVQADGDSLTQLPLEIRMENIALNIIAPVR